MNPEIEKLAVIVLAAGKGKRMKSDIPKVLHEILGRAMILYLVDTVREISREIILVVGHKAEMVQKAVSRDGIKFVVQEKQLGTGHAVMCALPVLSGQIENVLILCGDTPLVRAETLLALLAEHSREKRDLTLLAVDVPDPTGYGRILLDGSGNVDRIVEEADASELQRKIKKINSGIYCIRRECLFKSLAKIRSDNAQGEQYLTDIVGICRDEGRRVGVRTGLDPDEIIGVNHPHDLLRVEGILKRRTGSGSGKSA
jgi:UDP-N-acetylglucosamine diphosphorylase/glucosamine-1-phosphate N-acetyltransferase